MTTQKYKFNRAKDGWEILEDVPFTKPKKGQVLELVKVTDNLVSTEEMLKVAKRENCLNGQGLAEYLLENPDLIPEEAKSYYLIFPSTVWQRSDGDRHVPYFYWNGDQWRLRFSWLGNDWNSNGRLVRFRESDTKNLGSDWNTRILELEKFKEKVEKILKL